MTPATKDSLKQIAFHLRGLADAIEQLGGDQKAETPVENPALDDVVPWKTYPARVRKVGVILSYKILRRSGLQPISPAYTDSVKTFRDLLREGRSKAISTNGCGAGTIKTLDDEFAARNCPEWLTS